MLPDGLRGAGLHGMRHFTGTRQAECDGERDQEGTAGTEATAALEGTAAATTRSTPMRGLFRSLPAFSTGRSCPASYPLRQVPGAA